MHHPYARILVLTLCLGFAFQPFAAGQDYKISRAREKLKQARQDLSNSRDRLETVYMQLEKEFKRIAGSHATPFNSGVAETWMESLPRIQALWDEEMQKGRTPSRRVFREKVFPLLEEDARQVLPLNSKLLFPFLSEGSNLLYDGLKKHTLPDRLDFEDRLDKLLGPEVYFHHFWNDHLYKDLEEAKEFAKANVAFAEASTELDMLEHPEKYTSKGKLAPPRMVYVPGGNYTVGPNTGWEKSKRKVNLREYYMDKYEITNKEYNDFLQTVDHSLYEEYVPFFWPKNMNLVRVYPEKEANRPVSGVSWKAAHAYAEWAGKRLPTEEEWEVAARGKTGNIYPWGDTYEVNRLNAAELELNTLAEVGTFPDGASVFGCMDMGGNVWEWTASDQDGNRIKEPDDKVRNMVIRGGDYRVDGTIHARCDYRGLVPTDPYAGRRPSKNAIGFRCVKNVD